MTQLSKAISTKLVNRLTSMPDTDDWSEQLAREVPEPPMPRNLARNHGPDSGWRVGWMHGYFAAMQARTKTREEAAHAAFTAMQRKEAERIAALPPGTCDQCDGVGGMGGQFCGGLEWTCEACGGTGKTPNSNSTTP